MSINKSRNHILRKKCRNFRKSKLPSTDFDWLSVYQFDPRRSTVVRIYAHFSHLSGPFSQTRGPDKDSSREIRMSKISWWPLFCPILTGVYSHCDAKTMTNFTIRRVCLRENRITFGATWISPSTVSSLSANVSIQHPHPDLLMHPYPDLLVHPYHRTTLWSMTCDTGIIATA